MGGGAGEDVFGDVRVIDDSFSFEDCKNSARMVTFTTVPTPGSLDTAMAPPMRLTI